MVPETAPVVQGNPAALMAISAAVTVIPVGLNTRTVSTDPVRDIEVMLRIFLN